MGFLDAIQSGASSIVKAGSSFAGAVQDIRGQKPEPTPPPPTPPKPSRPASIPASKPQVTNKTNTVVKEKPVYIQAPPQETIREVIQSPQPPPVSYTQDTSQWRTPEYDQASQDLLSAQKAYTGSPIYEAGVKDIQSQIVDEQAAMENILSNAHKSYESLKDASEFRGYWEDKSTGSKVMAAIGLLFGAMGQGMHGKKNIALEILLKNIDKDAEIKEKRIINSIRKVNYSSAGANLKAKKIELLNKQLNDLSLGKPYAVAAAQAAALAQKTGNPTHEEAARFINDSLDMRNLQIKVEDLKNLKEQTLSRSYAEMPQAPKSTITKEVVTGKMLKPIVGKSGRSGTKPLTAIQEFNQEDKLRTAATSKVFGKAYDYAANFERFRIKLKTMLNSNNPYDHYNILLEAAKLLQGDKSVVREPEMRAFASSTNLANTLENWVDNWFKGTKFQKSQIQDLYQTMTKGAAASALQYRKMIRPILNAADKIGIPHENIYSKNAMYMTDEEVRAEYKRRKGLK
jgi:hypothetical protein